MKKSLFISFVLLLAGFHFACASQKAVAEIRGTSDRNISGNASFTQTPQGLKISVEVQGVPPGKHGFHVHEVGDCSDTGKAAGGHFNPDNHEHGEVLNHGIAKSHAGDFGNIEIGPDGTGVKELTVPELTLSEGRYNILGRAIIIHEKEDDFGQPTGNAGGRIACGVIQTGA